MIKKQRNHLIDCPFDSILKKLKIYVCPRKEAHWEPLKSHPVEGEKFIKLFILIKSQC